MPMDGLMLHAVVESCSKSLIGGRVDRVQQPERDEIILTIRAQGENQMILFSSNASQARMHRTYERKKNAETPPQFCMLLRKHLLGAKFVSLSQEGLDRIVHMQFENRNEIGDLARLTLTCEIMGRHSNIILTDDNGRIIDCARHVTQDISRVREVLPGLLYELPPGQDKHDPRTLSMENFLLLLQENRTVRLDKLLQENLSGLSTQAAQEISLRGGGDTRLYLENLSDADLEKIAQKIYSFFQNDLPFSRTCLLLSPEGEALDVTSFPYYSRDLSMQKQYDDPGEALDAFFSMRDKRERIRQRSSSLQHILSNAIERCERKLALQLETLEKSKDLDSLRKKGDLLLASQGQIPKGSTSCEVIDYYSEDLSPIRIELDPSQSIAQNAQRYYKQYAKLKQAAALVVDQKKKNDAELWYLRGQKENVENCTDYAELTEIREELVREGYIRDNLQKKRQSEPSRPHRFLSPDGTEVFVGKNNLQNDRLTFAALGDDWWLHVKDMPGSHVIIRSQHPTAETIAFAAMLAASFSSGKQSSKVPVDLTQRKYVKKPSGAKPGFVIYTHQRTVMASPDEEKVRSLLLQNLTYSPGRQV